MKISKIEEVMYLIRMNLYWNEEDGVYEDWRESEVYSIIDNEVTLHKGEEYRSWDLDVLEARCHQLCEEHFKAMGWGI